MVKTDIVGSGHKLSVPLKKGRKIFKDDSSVISNSPFSTLFEEIDDFDDDYKFEINIYENIFTFPKIFSKISTGKVKLKIYYYKGGIK